MCTVCVDGVLLCAGGEKKREGKSSSFLKTDKNCSGLWEFKVGLAGHGFADSSRVLCIDPCITKCRIDFLKMLLYQK